MRSAEDKRRRQAIQRMRAKRKQQRNLQLLQRALVFVVAVALIVVAAQQIWRIKRTGEGQAPKGTERVAVDAPEFEVQLLTPNPYSRPQIAMEKIRGIVIHYTANPGSSAQQNRDYFEGLKDSGLTHVSSHFIVGIDGEIIQCIPSSEIAYASNDRNGDTLSIEVCHRDETGEFSGRAYRSLVHLTAWLCGKFELSAEQVIRHYDVTGKECPIYYVNHSDEWEQFLEDVDDYIGKR